ncbi:MAG: hypothetical protein H6658_12225 [Ardenticatenaceae bacterium]|nr:hypothetical protein [Ardenticatenaceae bacterium]
MWQSLGNRFPPKQAILEVFYMTVLVIEVWALFNILRELPALRYRESFWDMMGIIAIVQLVALVESVLVAAILVMTAVILPGRLLRQCFVVQSAVSILITAVWAIAIHYNPQPMTTWPSPQLTLWVGIYLLALLGINSLLTWSAQLQTVIHKLVQSTTLLAQVYLSLSVLAFVVVLIRNLF